MGRGARESFPMRTWVVLAPPEHAENVRQALHRLGILRRDVRAIRAEHEVAFPVESLPGTPPRTHPGRGTGAAIEGGSSPVLP